MKRPSMMSPSPPPLPPSYCDQESEFGEQKGDEDGFVDRHDDGRITERPHCTTLYKREKEIYKTKLSCDKYGLWREELKSGAARIEKQLKARWELEELIEEQLNRFYAHYTQSLIPIRLKDVAHILMPKWAPPQELAILSWLGDWRPSAILELMRGLARSSDSSIGADQLLNQLIHEIRTEEAVIDEEMAEIQATCVLYLPFAPMNCSSRSGGSALRSIRTEFQKIERVITKAQQLRHKALEMVVKNILNQTDVGEFLVAFSAIQDAVHQFGEQQRLRKGQVALPLKPSWSIVNGKQ